MGTRAKIVIGHTDHTGYWNVDKEYIRWKDGYIDAIKPILHQFKGNIGEYNATAKYPSWEFAEITDGVRFEAEFIYYLDLSNLLKVRCSIISIDWDFYAKYGETSYKVIWEGIL